jgi:hypothetical protein
MQKDTNALTLDQEGHLLAGMDDGYIYLSKDGGEKWAALSGEEIVLPPRGLASLWSRGKTPLSKTAVRSLVAYSRGRRQILAAATDVGVFRSRERGKRWLPANQDLPDTDAKTGLSNHIVRALAAIGPQKRANLYAGTEAGVFHVRENLNLRLMIMAIPILALLGLLWPGGLLTKLVMPFFFLLVSLIADLLVIGTRIIDRFLSQHHTISLGIPVQVLIAGKQGQLFAGTEQGLYRSNDGIGGSFMQRSGRQLARLLLGDLARRWQPVNSGLANQDIRALGVGSQGDHLLAGTGDGSVYRSPDDGDTWEPIGSNLPCKPILAVWGTNERVFAAGLPPESPLESNWSPFQVERNWIDLDQVYPQVSPDCWVILSDGRKRGPGLYMVTQVEDVNSRDPGRPGRFSRITVDRNVGLALFDRSSALVLIQAGELHLLSDRPPFEDVLTFDRFVPGLKGGQKLIVSGKRMRARLLSQAAESLKLISLDGLRSADLDVVEAYQVLGVRPGSIPGTKEWRLKTRGGFAGSVTAAMGQVILEPPGDGDEIVSELVELSQIGEDPLKRTMVKLRSPLSNLYDWPTITIYGNVVNATHGQTISGELLGSSEGLVAQQRFLLKYNPLTYTSAATGSGVESTLKIEINGVRWQQVTCFDRLDRERRAFTLQQDDQGRTAVHFGFGLHGTGIPSGADQIRATYRQGLGRVGNVGAGSLHLVQTALAGLKSVTNPLAASGGVDPETMAEAREEAPLSVRAMERIVSFNDYEDFTRQFAGIGKAQARLISSGHQQWLHITIADKVGNEVAQDSDLYKNLATAIHSARACPLPALRIDSFERVFFRLKARLWIEPAHQARMVEIQEMAEASLANAFAFDRREFGQPVAAADIITLIQSIPGIVAVELAQLYRHGQEAKPHNLLEAQAARWEDGQLHPAQMLLIQPIEGIELDLEITP